MKENFVGRKALVKLKIKEKEDLIYYIFVKSFRWNVGKPDYSPEIE